MERCQPWLGTYVSVRAEGLDDARLHAAIDAAFAAVRQVHVLMGFHDPDSELSRLNARAHAGPLEVHPWTYEVLARALEFFDATGGLFDCAVAPTLMAWGRLPATVAPRERHGTMAAVRLLPGLRVRFDAPLALDLGGIAKGYAVDRAVDALRAAGVPQGAVNAGGDLRLFGAAAQAVQVRDPANPSTLLTIGELADGAAATSASYFVRGEDDGACALVDPRTHTPAGGHRSYTVIAETCIVADALTKPLAITGAADAPWLQRFNAKGWVL